MNNNEYLKSFQLKYDKSNENPYYFEGIASTYKNIDKSGDLFLDGALDEEIGKRVPILNNHKGDILEALGYGEISRDGNNIIIKGEFIQGIELAERVVALKKGVIIF